MSTASVAAEHPLQIEIRAGGESAEPDIRERNRYPWDQLCHRDIAAAGNPADRIAGHQPRGIGIQPEDLRGAVNVEGA